MTRTAFIAAAMLAITGSAFASSDHYDSNDASQPVAGVDHALTASIRKGATAMYAGVDKMTTTGPARSFPPESGRGNWGN